MAFELDHRKKLENSLTKAVRRELRKSVQALNGTGAASEQVVHEARKRVKKVRAIVALLEHAGASLPRKDHKRLKSASRALSTIRDTSAVIESLDCVRHHYAKQFSKTSYGILRLALVDARSRHEAKTARDHALAGVANKLAKTRQSAATWRLPSIRMANVLEVIADSYRRSRKAMKHAHQTGQSATLHRWRKELKTLWYQLRLIRSLKPGVAPVIADLNRLQTALGSDHDSVILEATLRGCRELRGRRAELRQIKHLGAEMRRGLRRHAFALGRRVQAQSHRAFTRWIRSSALKK